jgi:putative membrane protein|tara:strand:- start:337 stop:726 length:390 start_codon:yes stop_codon:yes gene_type:complete
MWLVVWDLALDPAMSFLTPYWMWEDPGSYYGMPLINLLGWYVTGVALMAVIEGFSSRVRWVDLDTRWMAAYYCAMLAMPLGMLIAAGLWLGVVVTLVAVASASWLTALLGGRETAGRVEPASSPGGARV